MDLFEKVHACLLLDRVDDKTREVLHLVDNWQNAEDIRLNRDAVVDDLQPGRPAQIQYVDPQKVPRRNISSQTGRAAMMHAIAHIEYSAIDLALDAVYRFRHCPRSYYDDWLQIAKEETQHFLMVNDYLKNQGYSYGDFPVHGRLWEVAMESRHDVMLRMALVPRVFEARGLDATPAIVEKFARQKDSPALELLAIIQREEIGHVQVGTKWFNYFCQQRGLDAEKTFTNLIANNKGIYIKRPLAYEARKKAGFTDAEINYLDSIAR